MGGWAAKESGLSLGPSEQPFTLALGSTFESARMDVYILMATTCHRTTAPCHKLLHDLVVNGFVLNKYVFESQLTAQGFKPLRLFIKPS